MCQEAPCVLLVLLTLQRTNMVLPVDFMLLTRLFERAGPYNTKLYNAAINATFLDPD